MLMIKDLLQSKSLKQLSAMKTLLLIKMILNDLSISSGKEKKKELTIKTSWVFSIGIR